LLQEFSANGKDNVEKIVDDREVFWWGEQVTKQPLPIWKRGGQDFMWQRSLYSAENWKGNKTATVWYNGVDYLIAYYLAKKQGVI
jgi:hypothetical protein